MLDTPILFLIFNRPDTTFKVFEAIRLQKPKKLYIAADGPRKEKTAEYELCNQAKSIIHTIDWDCEVKTLFREDNLGCQLAIYSAINWFFETEEKGIILEDDCLPCESFFSFCEQMLLKYKDNEEIMLVSGTNYLFHKYNNKDAYYKSNLTLIWGWATWKRAWNKMSLTTSISDPTIIYDRFKNIDYSDYILQSLRSANDKKINSWAIYWSFSVMINKGYAIMPLKNQVSNIGTDGTHTRKEKSMSHFMTTQNFNFDSLKYIEDTSFSLKLDRINIQNINHIIALDNGYKTTFEKLKQRINDSFKYRTNLLKKRLPGLF